MQEGIQPLKSTPCRHTRASTCARVHPSPYTRNKRDAKLNVVHTPPSERVGAAVDLWTRNLEVLVSNLGRDTAYPHALVVLSSPSKQIMEYSNSSLIRLQLIRIEI
jgi:hypothetical protein